VWSVCAGWSTESVVERIFFRHAARFSPVRLPSPGRMRVFHLRITEFADVKTVINYQGLFFFAQDAAAGTLIVEGHARSIHFPGVAP
jgi:hypothetical protein